MTGAHARGSGRLAPLLRQHRRARGLSQEELAGLTTPPLSVATLSNLERSRTRPYRHTLDVLASALALNDAQRADLVAAWRADGGAGEPPELSREAQAPPLARNPLPAALNTFVGRTRELEQLTALLAGEVRLITLVGAPGTGKTRLAIEVSRQLVARQPAAAALDRVAFVSLAPLADPALVAPAIAGALGIPDTGAGALTDATAAVDALKQHLHTHPALLVLDNFEQVLAAAPMVVDLLAACPALRVVATSREPLRVTGEQVFPVPPLALPDCDGSAGLPDLLRNDAVALFVDRARAVSPSFELDSTSAQAVVQLCHRLDGLPLAIELAAGRVGSLPPAALLARWEAGAASAGLALLSEGPRDLPERQQTLRGAVEWSHDLLSAEEQEVFRRLGVFEGGFTLEAAEALCCHVPDAVHTVTSLAAKSLVQQVEGGLQPRFTMLETLRAYALDRLAAAHEAEPARSAHLAWLVDFTERGERALFTAERDRWIALVARENDNARAALRWVAEREDERSVELAERLLTSLAQLSALALVPECRLVAERLAARDDPPTAVRARFLANAYLFALYQGDLEQAGAWVATAVDTARAAGAPRPLADALFASGHLLQLGGRHAGAVKLLRESAGLYRDADDEQGRKGMALLGLGISEATANPAEADALMAEALDLYRRRDSWFGMSLAYNSMGIAAMVRGDAAGACIHHMTSLRLCHEHGDRWSAAYFLSTMMPALAELGDLENALPLMEELLSVAADLALPYYARDALVVFERLLPDAPPGGRAAELYARYADLVEPAGLGR